MLWSPSTRQDREYAELIERCVDSLHRTAMRLTGNPSEAEDLVQETCLRAYRAWPQLREREGARAWIFQVLRNAWVDQLRKTSRRPQLVAMEHDTPHPLADSPPAPGVADATERQALEEGFDEEVLAGMNDLPEEERPEKTPGRSIRRNAKD
jgi:RNA polymerase sigma-70 factor (ECF subfamily)